VSGTARRPRVAVLAALAAVQAALLPALGLPMFFRNEAAWHYLLWQKTPFLALFRDFLTSRSKMSNAVASRPLVRALEWIQVRVFGLHASAYVVFNGVVFVGFALALFGLASQLTGRGGAVLAVLLLVGCFQIVFYPVLNAIHGLQYPLEMALCTASLWAFATAFGGARRWFAPAIVLALLASTCHAATAIVVPLAVAALAATAPSLSPRRRVQVAVLSPLAVGLAFLIERGGSPGGITSQPDMAAKVRFAWAQLGVLGALLTKLPTGPALCWAFAFDALSPLAALRARPTALALAALGAAAPMWLAARAAPAAGVVGLCALILVSVRQRRAFVFLAVWAFAGVVLFLATPESNASYMRHLAVPCVLLMADAYRRMLLEHPSVRPRLVRRPLLVEWAAAAATLALVSGTVLALRVPVPGLSSKLEQVRYVSDLSLGFRDVLVTALQQVPPHGTLQFLRGRSRAEEMQSLYGADYFARLQPAKEEHYGQFVELLGRPDVRVRLVPLDSVGVATASPLVAVNAWEVEHVLQARAASAAATAPRTVTHGRARAAIFPPLSP
jgi:hypothetical protein